MKRFLTFGVALTVCLSLLSCAREEPPQPTPPPTETTVSTEPLSIDRFSFTRLQYTRFLFCSGAGAWGTTLNIHSDGTFHGTYHDSEMGSNANEYPMGTVFLCEFTGQFGEPVPVNDYTWSLPIRVLSYSQVPDSQEILNGIRYCYTTAFGIDQTGSLLLFSPDAPVEALPLEYRQWVDLADTESGPLSFWGLYNEPQQQGFSSSDLRQLVWDTIAEAEQEEDILDPQMRYNRWDVILNQVWGLLKQTLPENTMTQLTQLQLEWIGKRDAAAEQSASQCELEEAEIVRSSTAADWTKERVYYLMQYIE